MTLYELAKIKTYQDKMTMDTYFIDKMTVDVMPVDKMSLDEDMFSRHIDNRQLVYRRNGYRCDAC